ncbi:transcriptional regulator, TetR family [Paenibacillus aquistagni]|uniref:Transcriptional regulator, TetR family n=1 Tax=Paenibacillus aquistagni TaxID=1852522 RepID=A0A1X7L8F5_9BACL|nr:transcriptional regulator, TetR family [Paenibacillus aquistagni]
MLDTATDLFLSSGYHNTSIDDIVAVSKVSKTNIYYHFKSKEDILLHVMKQMIDQYEKKCSTVLAWHHVPVMARIEFVLRTIIHTPCQYDCQVGCPFVTLYAQSPPNNNTILELIKNFFTRMQSTLELLLLEGIRKQELPAKMPIPETAALIITMCEGGLFMSKIHQDPSYFDRLFYSLDWLVCQSKSASFFCI